MNLLLVLASLTVWPGTRSHLPASSSACLWERGSQGPSGGAVPSCQINPRSQRPAGRVTLGAPPPATTHLPLEVTPFRAVAPCVSPLRVSAQSPPQPIGSALWGLRDWMRLEAGAFRPVLNEPRCTPHIPRHWAPGPQAQKGPAFGLMLWSLWSKGPAFPFRSAPRGGRGSHAVPTPCPLSLGQFEGQFLCPPAPALIRPEFSPRGAGVLATHLSDPVAPQAGWGRGRGHPFHLDLSSSPWTHRVSQVRASVSWFGVLGIVSPAWAAVGTTIPEFWAHPPLIRCVTLSNKPLNFI